jgi:hypothetical protein
MNIITLDASIIYQLNLPRKRENVVENIIKNVRKGTVYFSPCFHVLEEESLNQNQVLKKLEIKDKKIIPSKAERSEITRVLYKPIYINMEQMYMIQIRWECDESFSSIYYESSERANKKDGSICLEDDYMSHLLIFLTNSYCIESIENGPTLYPIKFNIDEWSFKLNDFIKTVEQEILTSFIEKELNGLEVIDVADTEKPHVDHTEKSHIADTGETVHFKENQNVIQKRSKIPSIFLLFILSSFLIYNDFHVPFIVVMCIIKMSLSFLKDIDNFVNFVIV